MSTKRWDATLHRDFLSAIPWEEFRVLSATGPTLPGDFNGDDSVDAADYAAWRDSLGSKYTEDHYGIWKGNFGATRDASSASDAPSQPVPEPAAAWLLLLAVASFMRRAHLRRSDARQITVASAAVEIIHPTSR